MENKRRLWLKQIGLGIAGIGLTNVKSYAAPILPEIIIEDTNTSDATITLRSNENPYGPSPLARKAFADNIAISNRYNWDVAAQLIAAIALKNGVKEDTILLGAGSTEILDIVAKYASMGNGNYVIADPSYDYWTETLDNLGLKKIKIPLTAAKKLIYKQCWKR